MHKIMLSRHSPQRARLRALRTWLLLALFSTIVVPTLASDLASTSAGFAAFFGWDNPTLQQQRQTTADKQTQVEIAVCMAALGLSYDPVTPSLGSSPPELGPEEYAARYGFGVLDQPPPVQGLQRDPITEQINKLPTGERKRYVAALYQEPIWGQYGAGCVGKAAWRVYGPRDQAFARLDTYAASINELVQNDGRVKDADIAWAACMADAGIAIRSRAELEEAVRAQIAAPAAALAPGDAAARAALASYERRFALAVFRCDGPAQAIVASVRAGYESEFIAEHLAAMEEIRAAAYPD
jgi:hypothetical protein